MSRIKLYYWKELNFGDELSPYLVEKLTGNKHIYRKTTLKGFIHQLIDSIVKQKSIVLFFRLLGSFFTPGRIVLGAGSIADISNNKTVAWGAGLMIPDSRVNSGKFLAVRGKLTGDIILKRCLAEKLVYGDPGLLLPVVIPKSTPSHADKIGIIPHIFDFKYFNEKNRNNFKVINLATDDVEKVVDEIVECNYILSSSLHGLIVAHAYGIPALWIERHVLEETGFKFNDYFSSVGIPQYPGFRKLEEILFDKENVINFFNQNKSFSIPTIDIKGLQKDLLCIAPFKLLPKYQKYY